MAWKHLELLRNLKGQSEKTSDMFGDVLSNNSVQNSTTKIVNLLENTLCLLLNCFNFWLLGHCL